MRKLKFRKLEIKFGNRNFEELFENGILGKLNFEYWNLGMEFRELEIKFGNWELNLEIEI